MVVNIAPGIHLQHTSLITEKLNYLTSGIICFSIEPSTQTIYFLLGQETCFDDLNSNKGRWCDFGGKVEAEEDILHAAAREFSEESMCVVHLFKSKHVNCSQEYINEVYEMLLAKDYFLKVSVFLPPEGLSERVRVYFLKEIPWQPEVILRFNKARSVLLDIENGNLETIPFHLRKHPALEMKNNEVEGINKHFLEKFSIMWWSLDRLQEVIRRKGKYKGHQFRKSFLPVLNVLIKRLKKSFCF
jgi:hypothetical protein